MKGKKRERVAQDSIRDVAALLGFSHTFVYSQLPVWMAVHGLKVYEFAGDGGDRPFDGRKKRALRIRRSDIEELLKKLEIE